MAQALTLTEAAALRVGAIARKQGKPAILRLSVEGGGCSGFQYRFDLVSDSEADDVRVENGDQAALVDDVSLAYLAGSQIDFVDELAGSEFKVRNPNARSSCGCGVSFAG